MWKFWPASGLYGVCAVDDRLMSVSVSQNICAYIWSKNKPHNHTQQCICTCSTLQTHTYIYTYIYTHIQAIQPARTHSQPGKHAYPECKSGTPGTQWGGSVKNVCGLDRRTHDDAREALQQEHICGFEFLYVCWFDLVYVCGLFGVCSICLIRCIYVGSIWCMYVGSIWCIWHTFDQVTCMWVRFGVCMPEEHDCLLARNARWDWVNKVFVFDLAGQKRKAILFSRSQWSVLGQCHIKCKRQRTGKSLRFVFCRPSPTQGTLCVCVCMYTWIAVYVYACKCVCWFERQLWE
jgi:hypothetical protein